MLAALEKFPGVRPDPEALMEVLDPLQPRLYSISSSPTGAPGRLSLTVDQVRYAVAKRERLGVASTFLCERLRPGQRLRVYVQKAKDFALPADPATPIIMVGPGTGVAPFRAFLCERAQQARAGRSWLFFGHQHQATDFLYREEIERFLATGGLTRLSTAWSRDAAKKVYVQDRMREEGCELWEWLREGAHFYVCGDAKHMAKDVDAALHEIAALRGGLGTVGASTWLHHLRQVGRYQTDVY